jgi:signal transduction histidine kinase
MIGRHAAVDAPLPAPAAGRRRGVAGAPFLGWSTVRERRVAEAEARQKIVRLARLEAAGLERLVEGTRHVLVLLATGATMRAADAETCSRRFAEALARLPGYANLGAARPDGTIFCSGRPLPGTDVDASVTAWFRRVMASGAFAVGAAVEAIGSMVDVTERKRTEDALRQSEKVAAMGSLLAGVARELNNPLAVVLGQVGLLLRSVRGADAERVVSGDALGAETLAFLEESGVPCLLKPFAIDDVRRLLAELLAR